MRARAALLAAAAAAALLAIAAARRADQDFEFDDDADGAHGERRGRRYVYDPNNALCQALVCKKREVCLLRDSFTALCANKKDILRRGDAIVPAGGAGAGAGAGAGGGAGGGAEDDDVFYEGGAGARDRADRCVGCGGGARAQFLCGSDNRTYSSLCRLDLHNCVRRPAPPVALACRGFCPCAERRRRPQARAEAGELSESGEAREASEASAPHRRPAPEACALERMADRLLDWFSVLMEEARQPPPPPRGFPSGCKAEVRWMFAHLDTDGDGLLSANNLYALRHDERERCLRPFLSSCGGGGGGGVTRAAWCGCLRRAARPCAALARAARRAGRGARAGAWAPACDARGFYRPRQCHAALAECWCVDAHGGELPGTRTKGEPPCGPAPRSPPRSPPRPPPRSPPRAPLADDEDAAGSGDGDELY